MRMDKLSDGTPLFEVRWDVFKADWLAAGRPRRLVLDDGRPAVRSSQGHSYETLPWSLWEQIQTWFSDPTRRYTVARKRERLCEACNSPLHVAREFEHAWTFVCDTCKSTEIHGKDLVGGTHGAGEKEQR